MVLVSITKMKYALLKWFLGLVFSYSF